MLMKFDIDRCSESEFDRDYRLHEIAQHDRRRVRIGDVAKLYRIGRRHRVDAHRNDRRRRRRRRRQRRRERIRMEARERTEAWRSRMRRDGAGAWRHERKVSRQRLLKLDTTHVGKRILFVVVVVVE
jgi:hypothetical protein